MIYGLDGVLPDIDPSAWVAPDASVIGRVFLDAESSVWFKAVLRGDTEDIRVGPGSNVQDACILHTDVGFPLTIGRNCTIGHRATLHGCSIGDGTLIGMGATVLNGVRIGHGCLVGAGALITEGKVIPDGSLVMGAPGKVVRSLDAEGTMRLLQSARNYRANADRFRRGLTDASDSG